MGSISCVPAKVSRSFDSQTGCEATSLKKCVLFSQSNERLRWISRSFSPFWDELVSFDSNRLEWLGLAVEPSFDDVLLNIRMYINVAIAGVLRT